MMMENPEDTKSPISIRYMIRTRKLPRIEKKMTLADGEPQGRITTMQTSLRRKRMLWKKRQRLEGYIRNSCKK